MKEEGIAKARELRMQLDELEERLQAAAGEHRKELEEQKKRLQSMFDADRENDKLQFDRRLERRLEELTKEHNDLLRRRENESSKNHSKDLDQIQREWAKRWSDRERDYLEAEQQSSSERQRELDDAKEQYQKQQAESEKRHLLALKERGRIKNGSCFLFVWFVFLETNFKTHSDNFVIFETLLDRRDMSLLQEKLEELGRAREELDNDRLAHEKESAMKYSKALEQAKEQDRKSRIEMDNLRQREVEALELSIKEERKMYIESRESMELAHAREITALRALVEDERKRSREKSTRFEDELERKFALLAEGLEEQAREYHKHRLEKALSGLEHQAMSECDQTRVRNEAMLDAEERMNSRFQRMVSDLRESWNKEEQARASAADARLRAHFETVLEHAHEQLEMALALNDSVDKRWMEDVQRRNNQTLDGMKKFQNKCQRLYEERLKDYVESTENQLRRYEVQLLEAGATAANEKNELRSQLRRIKIACQRWRVDYQRMIEKRYEETINSVEERYLEEIKALQTELVAVRQKEGETILALNQQAKAEQEMRKEEVLRKRKEATEKQRIEREIAE